MQLSVSVTLLALMAVLATATVENVGPNTPWERSLFNSSMPGFPIPAGPFLVAQDTDGVVYALDTTTGQAAWSHALGCELIIGEESHVHSEGGLIFVAGCKAGGALAVSLHTGKPLWKLPGRPFAPLVSPDGLLALFVDEKNQLVGVEIDSGLTRWRMKHDDRLCEVSAANPRLPAAFSDFKQAHICFVGKASGKEYFATVDIRFGKVVRKLMPPRGKLMIDPRKPALQSVFVHKKKKHHAVGVMEDCTPQGGSCAVLLDHTLTTVTISETEKPLLWSVDGDRIVALLAESHNFTAIGVSGEGRLWTSVAEQPMVDPIITASLEEGKIAYFHRHPGSTESTMLTFLAVNNGKPLGTIDVVGNVTANVVQHNGFAAVATEEMVYIIPTDPSSSLQRRVFPVHELVSDLRIDSSKVGMARVTFSSGRLVYSVPLHLPL